jgi:hypothetical protein
MTSLATILILIHTLLSFAAIIAGVLAVADLVRSRAKSPSISSFITLAIATSLTGYVLPLKGVTPAVVVGVVALAILAFVLYAQSRANNGTFWRWGYVGGLVASLYLLVFVAVAQAFLKIGVLREAAPTQSEPPFAITQAIVLLAFVALGLFAVLSFKPPSFFVAAGSKAAI